MKRLGWIYSILIIMLAVLSCAKPPKPKRIIPAYIPNISADSSFIVMIDVGHGGYDPGEIADSTKITDPKVKRLQEKELNLKLALILKSLNKDSTIKIVFTREKDTFISLKNRFIRAKHLRPNLFLSIHNNDFYPDTVIRGFEMYTVDPNNPHYKESTAFGESLMSELRSLKYIKINGWRTRKERLFVLRNAVTPALLLEMGYMSNRLDFNDLLDKKKSIEVMGRVLNAIKKFKKKQRPLQRYYCNNWNFNFSYDTTRVFSNTLKYSNWAVPVINGVEYNNELLSEINPDKVTNINLRNATPYEIKTYGDIALDGIIEITTIHKDSTFLFSNQQEKILWWAKKLNIDSAAVGYENYPKKYY
jgi:N-acetylmuramoyl-L-alanine amidase